MPHRLPPLSAATRAELRRYIGQYGFAPLFDQIHQLEPHGRGRMKIDDSQRLEAMARHLAADNDLPPDGGALTELARRALIDCPRDGDFNKNGSVKKMRSRGCSANLTFSVLTSKAAAGTKGTGTKGNFNPYLSF